MAQEINVRVHMPTTEEGKKELEKRMADCLAVGICNIINRAPESKRLGLYEGVIEKVRTGEYFRTKEAEST